MWTFPIVTVPPTLEPVTLEEAKTYLRIDGTDQDDQVALFIAAARSEVESTTGTRLLTQTVKLSTNAFEDFEAFPVAPVQSITSIGYLDVNGDEQDLPAEAWSVVGGGLAWSIQPAPRTRFPQVLRQRDAVRVTAVAGYGDDVDAMPAQVRFAVLMLVRGMMDNMPADVSGQLTNHRVWL